MKNAVTFSFTLALPLALSAVTNYPSSGGDIATADGWGLDEVPSGVVGFALGVPYSASQAVTFAGMELSGSSGDSSTFSLSNGVSVALNGDTATDLNFKSSGLKATFKGGSLSVAKGSRIGYQAGVKNNTLVLDGCAFTHTGSTLMVGASASTGNAVVLTNGASAALASLEISNNGGFGNVFEVNAGCTVTTADIKSDSYGSQADTDSSLLLVRGAGASVSLAANKNLYIGWRHCNNTVTVADGAHLGVSGTGNIQFGVAVGTSGSSRCGHGTLNVVDGATVSCNNNLNMGVNSYANRVFISNGTLSVAYAVVVGAESGNGTNAVVVSGPSASVTVPRFRIGLEAGSDCNSALLVNGATLTANVDLTVGGGGNYNVMRASGGAQLNCGSPVVGRSPKSNVAATTGNRLEILDGTTCTLVRPYVRGVGNGIVISNATLKSTNAQTNTFLVGDVADDCLASATSNNFIRLEGESPKVRVTQSGAGYRVWNKSRIEFVLPAAPYAEAPLRGSQLQVDDTSDLVFDFSALDAVQHGSQKYRLFETTTANETLKSMLSEESLARANARLSGRGASIAWEGTGVGSALVLSVKGNNGMVILFR